MIDYKRMYNSEQEPEFYRSRNWEIVSFDDETNTLYVLEQQFICYYFIAVDDGMNQCGDPILIPSYLQRYSLIDLSDYEPYLTDPNFSIISEVKNLLIRRAEYDGVNIDQDDDGILDAFDNYKLIPIGNFRDTDSDGAPDSCDTQCAELGMAADTDDDNDGVLDTADAYPLISLGSLNDSDSDGAPDTCDSACIALGMSADLDDDNDGYSDEYELNVGSDPLDGDILPMNSLDITIIQAVLMKNKTTPTTQSTDNKE